MSAICLSTFFKWWDLEYAYSLQKTCLNHSCCFSNIWSTSWFQQVTECLGFQFTPQCKISKSTVLAGKHYICPMFRFHSKLTDHVHTSTFFTTKLKIPKFYLLPRKGRKDLNPVLAQGIQTPKTPLSALTRISVFISEVASNSLGVLVNGENTWALTCHQLTSNTFTLGV